MMKNLVVIGAVIVTTVSLVGCATYKSSEAGLSKIGYEEKLLDDGSYQLTYYGSGFNEHDEIVALWHKRAGELCNDQEYESETRNEHWVSDGYTVLPPFVFKSKSAAPSIEGKLRCKGEAINSIK